MILTLPEIKTLRELRTMLARGGMPPFDKRTPDDCVRIAAFRVIQDLLRLIDRYQRRLQEGEPCRLVEREHASKGEAMLIELTIETIKEVEQ